MKKVVTEECKHDIFCLKLFKLIFGILLIVSVFYLIFATKAKIKEIEYSGVSQNNTITVSKTSYVYVKPDTATVSFSALTEAKTPEKALETNSQKAKDIITIIEAQGVSESDIKTTNFTITPVYEFYKDEDGISRRQLVGYQASESVEVKVRQFDKIGSVIESAVGVGANEISDLRLTIDNPDPFKAQARDKAILLAKAEAIELASKIGVKLGKIVNFSESSYLPYYYEKVPAGAGIGGASVDSISPGVNRIESTVYITYQIK